MMFTMQEMNPRIPSDVEVHEPLIDTLPIEIGASVPKILVLRDWPMDRPNEYKVNFILFYSFHNIIKIYSIILC